MTLSVVTYAILTGCCGLAQSAVQLAGLRFLAATGMGGEWALGVALVMETWPASWRPVLAGLIGAAANFGYCCVAGVALAVFSLSGAREGAATLGLALSSVVVSVVAIAGVAVDAVSGTLALGTWSLLDSPLVEQAYAVLDGCFPLSPAVIDVYDGPPTTRARHPLVAGPGCWTNGMRELLVGLASG